MNWLTLLTGNIRLKLTSASTTDMLASINASGIVLSDVSFVDELTVCVTLQRSDLKNLQKLLSHRGEQYVIQKRSGFYWTLVNFKKRPLLLIGMFILLSLILWLPGRILFVSVEGNHNIPEKLILDKAEKCGVGFGVSRRDIRSEQIKNALLEAIPELQWTGVNTYGCVAVITVRERSDKSENEKPSGVCSIVASQDGIVSNITVLRGNPLCKTGDAVKEGQVLVSGYTDCGLTVRAEAADAEIFAQTNRILECITPAENLQRGEYSHKEERYALRVGKKLINFCKFSRISDTTCVKMYSENILTLPGGFALPVALVKITYYYYDAVTATSADTTDFAWLNRQAEDYLKKQMLSGQILQRFETVKLTKDICVLSGRYACEEMIGQIRTEEFINHNG